MSTIKIVWDNTAQGRITYDGAPAGEVRYVAGGFKGIAAYIDFECEASLKALSRAVAFIFRGYNAKVIALPRTEQDRLEQEEQERESRRELLTTFVSSAILIVFLFISLGGGR